MSEFLHILDRASIHFTASCSLVLMFAVLLHWLRKKCSWLPNTMQVILVWSALVVCLIAFVREPFDVAAGQSTTKAVTDYVSWFLGTGFSCFGLYRWKYFTWEV